MVAFPVFDSSFQWILQFLQTLRLHFTNLNVLTDGSVSLQYSNKILRIKEILLLDKNTISLLHFLLWQFYWPKLTAISICVYTASILITSLTLKLGVPTKYFYVWRRVHAMGAYGDTVLYTEQLFNQER